MIKWNQTSYELPEMYNISGIKSSEAVLTCDSLGESLNILILSKMPWESFSTWKDQGAHKVLAPNYWAKINLPTEQSCKKQ